MTHSHTASHRPAVSSADVMSTSQVRTSPVQMWATASAMISVGIS
jgi:hypothetical protein